MMPFIGVIVSPYDTRLSSPSSSITMFYVEPSHAVSSGCGTPMRCIYCTSALPPQGLPHQLANPELATAAPPVGAVGGAAASRLSGGCGTVLVGSPAGSELALGRNELSERYRRYWERQLRSTVRVLCALVHYYKENRSRTQLQAVWKQKAKQSVAGAQPASKLDKLRRSVRGRLLDGPFESVDHVLQDVVRCIETHWKR